MSMCPTFVQDNQGVWHQNPVLVNPERTFFIYFDEGDAEFVGLQSAFPSLRHIRDALISIGFEQPRGKLYYHRGQRDFRAMSGSPGFYNAVYCQIDILKAPRADLFHSDEGKFDEHPPEEGYFLCDYPQAAQSEPPMC